MVLRATCHWEDPGRLANGLGEELEMIKRDWIQEGEDALWKPFAIKEIEESRFHHS